MNIKIKSTVVPLEYIDRFPCNDLHTIKGNNCYLIDQSGKILQDDKKLYDTFGPNDNSHHLCGSGLAVLG